jgi:hypothetical protein
MANQNPPDTIDNPNAATPSYVVFNNGSANVPVSPSNPFPVLNGVSGFSGIYGVSGNSNPPDTIDNPNAATPAYLVFNNGTQVVKVSPSNPLPITGAGGGGLSGYSGFSGYSGSGVSGYSGISGYSGTVNQSSVAITGGNIDGAYIGQTTAAPGTFSTAQVNNKLFLSTLQATSTAGVAIDNNSGTTKAIFGATGGTTLSDSVVAITGELQLSNVTTATPFTLNSSGTNGTSTSYGMGDLVGSGTFAISNTNGAGYLNFLVGDGTKQSLQLVNNTDIKFPNGTKGMVQGFPVIPALTGTPGTTPDGSYQYGAQMAYDQETDSLWIYNSVTPGWRTVSVGPSYLQARASTGQAIANATDTLVAIDTADTNTSDLTLSGDTNYRFLNNTGGQVTCTISYQVSWDTASPTTGSYATWIAINGDLSTNRFAMQNQGFNAGDYNCQSGTATLTLNNGDYFQVWCWQNSGSSANINGAGSGMSAGYSTKLTVVVH